MSYNEIVMLSSLAAEHVHNPRNTGPLADATHLGVSGTPGDGPYVKIWLCVKSSKVERAAYQTHGCPSSVAPASLVSQLVIGKDLKWIQNLTGADILTVLGGLPEGKEKFAYMAVAALQNASTNKKELIQ